MQGVIPVGEKTKNQPHATTVWHAHNPITTCTYRKGVQLW